MTVRLEELLAASTPGPWDHTADALVAAFSADGEFPDVKLGHSIVAGCESWEDARLVALAPEMARLLIDMDESLRACHHDFDPTEDECSVCTPLLARLDALGKDTA